MSTRSNYERKEYPDTVCAYMAGILDGEGCLSIGNYSRNTKTGDKHFQVNIAVSSIDEVLIDWIVNTFGGFKGKYTPKQMAKTSRRQVYRWQCSGDRLKHICELVLPYTVIKRREVEILLEARNTFNDLQSVKGKQGTQRLPPEILETRQRLFEELRSIHQRAYNYRVN